MQDSFFAVHEARLGFRFPPKFRHAYATRRVLTKRGRWTFCVPHDWKRASDVEEMPGAAEISGVVVAWDIGGDALILRPEGSELGEALWLWSHESVPLTKEAPSLDALLSRKKPRSPQAELEAQANAILAAARKKRAR